MVSASRRLGVERIRDHFRLLQATDNLSLLSCVGYSKPATLLHPLPLRDGSYAEVRVIPLGERHFQLEPYPFNSIVSDFHLSGAIGRRQDILERCRNSRRNSLQRLWLNLLLQ